MKRFPLSLRLLLLSFLSLQVIEAKDPVELGTVDWLRDYDQALEVAGKSGKPILLLFQEVPGCAGCQIYGRDVLSHPLLADAIERAFVPVAIRNNSRGDKDAATLQKFKEPTWNYQVIRYLDAKGRELLPREDKVWTLRATAERMASALNKAGAPRPGTLEALLSETAPAKRVALFSMFCYYTGEKTFGALPGVASTEAGWYDGREVVKVSYDPETVPLQTLTVAGQKQKCADLIYLPEGTTAELSDSIDRLAKGRVRSFSAKGYTRAQASEQKVYLNHSILKKLNLTPTQASCVNALLGQRASDDEINNWLTRSQQEALKGG